MSDPHSEPRVGDGFMAVVLWLVAVVVFVVLGLVWSSGAFAADTVSWSIPSDGPACSGSPPYGASASTALQAFQNNIAGVNANCASFGLHFDVVSVSAEAFSGGSYSATGSYSGSSTGTKQLVGNCSPVGSCTGVDSGGAGLDWASTPQLLQAVVVSLAALAFFGGIKSGMVR